MAFDAVTAGALHKIFNGKFRDIIPESEGNAFERSTRPLTDQRVIDAIPTTSSSEILVLGRKQRVVDYFAKRRADLLNEQTYTVSTPEKKINWMAWIEDKASIAGEDSIAARVRNTLNYASDAIQVGRARTIYQNTWDWQNSPYTVSEMAQTWIWGKIGNKEIIRFYEPWEIPNP